MAPFLQCHGLLLMYHSIPPVHWYILVFVSIQALVTFQLQWPMWGPPLRLFQSLTVSEHTTTWQCANCRHHCSQKRWNPWSQLPALHCTPHHPPLNSSINIIPQILLYCYTVYCLFVPNMSGTETQRLESKDASCFSYYLSTLHLTIPYYKCWPSIYKLHNYISASQNKKWFNVYWHVIYSCTQVQLSKSLFRVAQPPSGALVYYVYYMISTLLSAALAHMMGGIISRLVQT